MQLADRIAFEERRAHDRRAHEALALDSRARNQPRYIAVRRDAAGTHLTIRGRAWRPLLGWSLVICGAVFAIPGLLWLPWLVVCLGLAIAGGALIASPRSTIHVVAAPEGFAVYTTSLDRPHHVGRHSALTVEAYHWRGATGVHVRVWSARYWEQTFMGIGHPDDFLAVKIFNAERGR